MLLRSEIQAKYIKHSNTDNRAGQTAIFFLFRIAYLLTFSGRFGIIISGGYSSTLWRA